MLPRQLLPARLLPYNFNFVISFILKYSFQFSHNNNNKKKIYEII